MYQTRPEISIDSVRRAASAIDTYKLFLRAQQTLAVLDPDGRRKAALDGLAHDADPGAVILSAAILQSDARVYEDVRNEFAAKNVKIDDASRRRDLYANDEMNANLATYTGQAAAFDRMFGNQNAAPVLSPSAQKIEQILRPAMSPNRTGNAVRNPVLAPNIVNRSPNSSPAVTNIGDEKPLPPPRPPRKDLPTAPSVLQTTASQANAVNPPANVMSAPNGGGQKLGAKAAIGLPNSASTVSPLADKPRANAVLKQNQKVGSPAITLELQQHFVAKGLSK